jgi:N-acetylglutamate synthase-like GNAT family acetyltransferase
MTQPAEKTENPWTVRLYQPQDKPQVNRLYEEGMLAGQVDPRDTAADIDNIADAYFSDSRDSFWVAQANAEVIGTIAVAHELEHTAQVRRLRVDKAWQPTTVASDLIKTALSHCRHAGYLKVVFETRFERTATVDLFQRLGFHYTRARNVFDKELLEFYLNLYKSQHPDP